MFDSWPILRRVTTASAAAWSPDIRALICITPRDQTRGGAGIEDLGRLLAEGDFDRFDWARQSSAGDLSIHAGRVGDARAGPKQHDDRPRSGGIERAVDRPVFVEGGGQARVSKQRRRGRS